MDDAHTLQGKEADREQHANCENVRDVYMAHAGCDCVLRHMSGQGWASCTTCAQPAAQL